jgi:hypothetical protein
MIHFPCPHCGAKLRIPEAHAGKEGPCPRCKKRLKVPPAPELELVREGAPENTRRPSKLLEQLAVQPAPLPVAQESHTPQDALTQRLLDSFARDSASEHTGTRHLPWPLDILLYPANLGGFTTLIIIVGIPLLLGLLPLGLAGWLLQAVIRLYAVWYLAECVYDSAKGGTRAPMALDTTDLGTLWSRVLYLVAVYIMFVFPAVIYWIWTRRTDPIFWGLVAWGAVFFPMGLLAMVIHDSTSALNPFFLLGAIFRTFLPYVGLVLLLGILLALYRWTFRSLSSATQGSWLLQAPVVFAMAYMSFIGAHVLGRFYWRYRERLDWGI